MNMTSIEANGWIMTYNNDTKEVVSITNNGVDGLVAITNKFDLLVFNASISSFSQFSKFVCDLMGAWSAITKFRKVVED